MENVNERFQTDDSEQRKKRTDFDVLREKWGVSQEQIDDAIANVGIGRTDIEEYLVNKKWQQGSAKDHTSFQKRDLNEDETY
jgi:hypothetical protein